MMHTMQMMQMMQRFRPIGGFMYGLLLLACSGSGQTSTAPDTGAVVTTELQLQALERTADELAARVDKLRLIPGPRGPAGEKGPPGDRGAAGADGLSITQSELDAWRNEVTTSTLRAGTDNIVPQLMALSATLATVEQGFVLLQGTFSAIRIEEDDPNAY